MRCTQQLTKMMDSFLPREFIPRKACRVQFQVRSLLPVFPFQRITNRRRCKSIGIDKRDGKDRIDRRKIVDLFPGKIILSFLEVSINEVVKSMKLLVPVSFLSKIFSITLCCIGGLDIGLD